MRDEEVERAPEFYAVNQQSGEQAPGSEIRFCLTILVYAIRTVADGAAEAADQKAFMADQF